LPTGGIWQWAKNSVRPICPRRLQIKAENGAFSVLNFDPAKEGILEQIRRELTPHVLNAPTAELYNLNIYASGGHFAPHKDTPRGGDMLGTLVVCLPSQFSNGAFVLLLSIRRLPDYGAALCGCSAAAILA
jgi:hypothetical protein